jgi:hypothetical protein
MRQRLLSHLTYANVISTLALFLVLSGGVAYAANTVFSSDIVDNQVYSADVRNDTLTGGGLAAADLRPGSVGPSEAAGLTGADIANAASGSDNVNADKLDGVDASQLEGARAYALSGAGSCPGDPVVFCGIPRSKGVAYIVKVGEGTYCIGVNGISAADPTSVALVSQVSGQNHYWWAAWKPANAACASQEFEVGAGDANGVDSGVPFTIAIP